MLTRRLMLHSKGNTLIWNMPQKTGNGANIVYPGSKATVKDCIFRGNSATGLCAAIYLCDSNANAGETPELTVLNSEFSGNTTNGRGGAIGARATASVGVKLIVANSTFFGNTCKSTGSAIALWGAADKPVTADIYSCTITGNTTTRATTTAGGAIGQETKGVTVNIYNSILSGNSWSANAPAANLYTVDATTAKAYKSINASAVYGADGAVDSGAPAFAPLAMLSKKTQEGKSTVFQLVGDNNPAQTYGYDAASLKALNASLQDVLGKDQWGNTRSASKMGASVE